MPLSMYQASIPTFIHALNNLSAILGKAAAYATEANKIAPETLINARLYPNMFPLSRQVQIASDVVKGFAGRISGTETPSFPDTESTFPELQARIQKTIAFLETIKPAAVDGTEEKSIALKVGGNELAFTGQTYLLHFVIPNLYFHITATYAILRHHGLDVGKGDFLGKP